MKSIADRNLMRDYLLGKLDEQTELEDKLSDDILNNNNEEISDIVDSIEDQIIEGYLEGTLNLADTDAVDKYFLQPPQRREKLRFAQILKHYFETKASLYSATKHDNLVRPAIPLITHLRTYGTFAALALVIISTLIYASGIRRSHSRLENELAEERARSSSLVRQADLLQASMVPLTLVADRSRGAEAPIPQVDIKSSTQRIIVEIALQGVASGPYDVRLARRAAVVCKIATDNLQQWRCPTGV